jgi:phosphatidate cytidylyltransferase
MFLTRLLTVVVALPAFAAALFLLPPLGWVLVLTPALAIASWEWGGLAHYRAAARGGYAALVVVSALALAYLQPAALDMRGRVDLWVYATSCAFWVAVAPFWVGGHWTIRNPLLLGAAGWLALVPMALALVRLQASPWALLLFLSIVWIADTAAYLAGKRWGRHKLAPAVSPGKSWEGVVGAVFALAVYYAILSSIVPAGERYFHGWPGVVIFAAVLALSIEGDLFESWMKRQAGVKDSGSLLPGHGGLLDRIDGLTATLPAAALAFYLIRASSL